MSRTQDQDLFQEATVKTPMTDLATSLNTLDAGDLSRGALTREHVPTNITGIFTGSMMVSGAHGVHPVGFEPYVNATLEDAVGTGELFPRYDWRTGNPMRTTGTSPPYGADTTAGWSIIADNNNSAEAAEIPINSLNIDTHDAFSEGRLVLNVSGFVEVYRFEDDDEEAEVGIARGVLGPLIGVAVKVGTQYYVIPQSIGMFHSSIYMDTLEVRVDIDFAKMDSLVDDQVSPNRVLHSIALVFANFNWTPLEGYQPIGHQLGTWNLTAEPVVRGSF